MRTPRFRRGSAAVLALAVVYAAACGDAPDRGPAAPVAPPSLDVIAAAGPFQCVNNPTAQQIGQDINALLTGTARQTASQQFNNVKQNCSSNLALAQTQMFGVVQTVLGALPPSVRASWLVTDVRAITLARLLNNLFLYVGYESPGILPITTTRGGALAILTHPTSGLTDIISGDGNAILRVPANATTGSHLFSITPIAANCLSTNLEQLGGCFDISADPEVGQFAANLTVGICQTRDLSQNPGLDKRRIGHESNSANDITEVLPLAVLPQIAGFCGEPPSSDADVLPTDAGLIDRVLHGARRFASGVARVVGPKTAYALHGGLGGITPALSPFGTVNRDVFIASFDNNPVGPLTAATVPERGDWTIAMVDPPGALSIIVEPGAAPNQLAVLNQGGGACTVCGGLRLRGEIDPSHLSGEAANEGVYQIDFVLAQQKPTVKAAPFLVLDSQGREIARLEFRTLSSQRQLLYNGEIVGSWTVGVKQAFSIFVNYADVPLNNSGLLRTRLEINGVPAANGKLWPFQNPAADDLRFLEANFTGIDAGIFYMDAIRIKRVDDPQS